MEAERLFWVLSSRFCLLTEVPKAQQQDAGWGTWLLHINP